MRGSVGFCAALLVAGRVLAQTIPVTFSINTSQDTVRISPYVYGANMNVVEPGVGIAAHRLGGNRMTGYNWENNASNAGIDYINSSDDYMTYVFGIPPSLEFVPGITLTAFHDTSIARGWYTLLTLPAAGYVARDIDGAVTPAQTAPSSRWREVRPFKGAPFVLNPDTSDGYVYVDEEVNFLTNRYGPASGVTGVKGYSVDNEPALWPSTHPRLHPDSTLCHELIAKVAATGRAVKSVDPTAEVFGGVFYGFGEYYHMQWAPDWNLYQSYENFAAALLANLRDSSVAAGERLLDVLDMHWYPDLNVDIGNENTDSSTVVHRMQTPRTLWDSTFVEDGWIGQYFHQESSAIIRRTQRIIAQQYPGTKLSVSEYNYGGSTHISGAIAEADVLGIFGENGVYFSSLWGDITGFIAAGYRMYRNYDGIGGTFGDISVHAASTDSDDSAVHAAIHANDPSTLNIIAINRNYSSSISGQFVISSSVQYASAAVYGLLPGNSQIQAMPAVSSIQGNQFSYTLPAMSVVHFVLSVATGVTEGPHTPRSFALYQNYPNPFNPSTAIDYQIPVAGFVTLTVYDILGREVATLVNEVKEPGSYRVQFDGSARASGTYFYRIQAGQFTSTKRLVLLK